MNIGDSDGFTCTGTSLANGPYRGNQPSRTQYHHLNKAHRDKLWRNKIPIVLALFVVLKILLSFEQMRSSLVLAVLGNFFSIENVFAHGDCSGIPNIAVDQVSSGSNAVSGFNDRLIISFPQAFFEASHTFYRKAPCYAIKTIITPSINIAFCREMV